MARFEECLDVTLQFEGGYVDHPKDPGGATNMGITFAVLQKWVGRKITKTDVKNISRQMVEAIYKKNYWNAAGCDRLFPGVDLAVFDASVNSGVSRGKKWLLSSVGSNDHSVTVKRICAARLGFVQSLKIWETFGRGWLRRITTIEATGVKTALAAMGLAERDVESKLRVEEIKAKNTAGTQVVVAGGSGGAAAGAGTTASVDALPPGIQDLPPIAVSMFVLAAAAFGAWMLYRHFVNSQRASAYNAALLEA